MTAARCARPARAVLAAALLCGIAACTREAGQQQAAAASAPPAAAKPDYMTEHIARDAALSDALIGTWSETDTGDDGKPGDIVIRYAADRTLSAVITWKGTSDPPTILKGTWSVAQGFLTYQVTPEGTDKTLSGSDEILRIDKSQFTYVDGDDKKTKIATRRPDAAIAAATAAKPETAPAPAPAAAPALTVAAPAPADTPFADENLFVEEKQIETYVFRLSDTAMVRLTADIAERVPLNVIVLPGQISGDRFAGAVGNLIYAQLVTILEDSKIKGVNTLDDFFASRLSKRAAYGRFDSPWVRLNPGTYTVVLDNWGELGPPSRGDAPVHLQLYSRPAS